MVLIWGQFQPNWYTVPNSTPYSGLVGATYWPFLFEPINYKLCGPLPARVIDEFHSLRIFI